MARTRRADNPRCGHCGSAETVGNGSEHGRKRWRCRACGRTFGTTTGTPVWGLKTPVDEVARALLVVLRRGSLRAAEEVTGHKYETIAKWLRRAGDHAEALTPVLVHDLQLTAVEIDEFWSFVGQKGAPGMSRRRGVSLGAG
jgi:transposase-like protein